MFIFSATNTDYNINFFPVACRFPCDTINIGVSSSGVLCFS
jgi:hypothetical protein